MSILSTHKCFGAVVLDHYASLERMEGEVPVKKEEIVEIRKITGRCHAKKNCIDGEV